MVLLINSNEDNTEIKAWLDHYGISYQVSKLVFPVGDYIVGGYEDDENVYGRIVIEHKTAFDYIDSLHSERLNNQEYDLSWNFRMSVLVITGDLELTLIQNKQKYMERYGRVMSIDEVERTLTTVAAGLVSSMWKTANDGEDGNIAVMNFLNARLTAKFFGALERYTIREDPRVPKMLKVSSEPENLVRYAIQSVPGIGEGKVDKVLHKFKDIAEFYNSSRKELEEKIHRVGEKTSKKMHDFFHLPFEDIQ